MKKRVYIGILLIVVTLMAYAGTDYEDFVLPAERFGKWGYITREGQWKIQAKFEKAYHFTEGLAAVKSNGRWGYIDYAGEWRIKPQYDEARPFKEGLAGAMAIDKWGYIDKTGQWIINPKYKAVSSFSDGLALVKSAGGYTFIDQNGRHIITEIFRKALPFANGLAFVYYAGYKGYIDRKGNWLIRHNFEEAYSFSEGLALVRKNDKYGFIDKKGYMAIESKYEDAGYFMEGFAPVKVGGNWGYINRRGKMIIRPKYDRAFPFANGFAIVRYSGRYGMIDRKGAWILNPVYSGLGAYSRSISVEEMIQRRLQRQLGEWQLKSEFEKTEDYHVRTSKTNLEAQARVFTEAAIQYYAKKYVQLNRAEPGLYDADLEQFCVRIPGAYPIRLTVPISDAPVVKEHWDMVEFKNPVYAIRGDLFIIKTVIAAYDDKEYAYSQHEDYNSAGIPVFHMQVQKLQKEIPTLSIQSGQQIPGIPAGISDVDRQIPETSLENNKTFALVIGNEDYSEYQKDLKSEANVEYAASDARIFSEYLIKTLGLPAENVTLMVNATAGQMRRGLSKMRAITKAYEGDANIIFYYAGHGLPDEDTHMPYLVPVDVNSSDLEYAVNLEDAYNTLTGFDAKRVTVFLDACFSGGGRNEGLIRSRGIKIKPKSPFVLGNLIVFAATSEDQQAYSFAEKAHGMFTYYLLKGLRISKGLITYGELADFIHINVSRKSVLINEKEQEPEMFVSPALESGWRGIQFFEQEAFPVARDH